MTTRTQAISAQSTDLWAMAAAAALGLALIFAAGFSNAQGLHDTAHDTRHAVAFPCH